MIIIITAGILSPSFHCSASMSSATLKRELSASLRTLQCYAALASDLQSGKQGRNIYTYEFFDIFSCAYPCSATLYSHRVSAAVIKFSSRSSLND